MMSEKNCPLPGLITGNNTAERVVPKSDPAWSRRGLLLSGLGGLGAMSLSGCGGGNAMAATVPDPTPAPTPAPAASESSITEYSYNSTLLGGSRYYKVYLPVGYAASGLRYPVIYLLHGRGDSLSAWGRNKAMFDELIATGKIPPVVLIFPDAPSSDRGNYYVDSAYTGAPPGAKVETEFMRELIPHVDATYRTIANRAARAVGGYSMGAYGALRYSLAYPETFSAAIVMSPAVYTPLPPAGSSTREFGAFGLGSSLFVDEIYRAKNYPALLDGFNAKNLKLAMFIAAGDDEYKNANPAEASNDIDFESALLFNRVSRVSNISAELRILDGDHDWVVWQPALREALPYVFKTLRKPE